MDSENAQLHEIRNWPVSVKLTLNSTHIMQLPLRKKQQCGTVTCGLQSLGRLCVPVSKNFGEHEGDSAKFRNFLVVNRQQQ